MTKRILDVGNCAFDHGNVRQMLARHFDAEVEQAHGAEDALKRLREGAFDLVLANRKFDRDGGDGIELIRQIAGNDRLGKMPVLLLSNYPQYQQQAVAAGAAPGFGKAELDSQSTVNLLRAALKQPASPRGGEASGS